MEKKSNIKTEQRAIDALLENGTEFKVQTRGLWHWICPIRTFKITQPKLGTLYAMAGEYTRIDLEESRLTENPLRESFHLVRENARAMSRVAAIALLNGKWRIALFKNALSRYLLWRLDPSQLIKLCLIVITISNTADFINSIRLIKGTRLTMPKRDIPIESEV